MEPYIYESSDNGRTIWRRKFGSNIRTKIKQTPESWDEYLRGTNYTQLANDYPIIQEQLEKLKTLTILCNG